MVKECFTTNERNFATRPNMAAGRYMNYDNAGFGMSPYGPYWREIRKMVVSELLTNQRLEKFKNWLSEHIEKRKECDNVDKEGDFMDVMLSALPEDAEMSGHGRETVIKATILFLIWAGTGSTGFTMTWALSLLLNHPDILKSAQKELDIHVGREK
ncbi:hypothetical protein L1987_50663 [Smallanthus sonchifolius]|uniref:Uncharacterized protein n=1 Tax=Smallanthus sonchifolius TaxID=185202 RepID=A0ACB9ENG6_9ASTR|nr:hypothetical protein L1987_50663 [Smallanthus sonchifolius]